MLLDAAREMIASYRDEGREPPVGGGHVESESGVGFDGRVRPW
jgi:hypothetical protein